MLHSQMPGWRPAPRSFVMAQASGQAPSSFDQMISAPELALATDIAAAGVGGLILYSYFRGKHQPLVGLWVVVTTAAIVKAFHDFGRL